MQNSLNKIMTKEKQYIYIVQASLETSRCKIGKTNDLERRLKEYNSMTGKSKDNIYQYLFACEVRDMSQVEKDIKEKFSIFREKKSREIYLLNDEVLIHYIKFIKKHKSFVEEITLNIKEKKQLIKITTPSLK
jgi:predicted GIY-YIG superfamily endonuclease